MAEWYGPQTVSAPRTWLISTTVLSQSLAFCRVAASGLTAFVSLVRMVTVVHFRPCLSSSARIGL